MNPNKYILVPHFYRLNWAREMSEFLKNSARFQYLGKDLVFGNYSKAAKLRDQYLNYLIENKSALDKRTLFFVNLNDYIYFERRQELREGFEIYGFMRGSRFFDGEPGNCSLSKDTLLNSQKAESEALTEIDKLFIGSQSFKNFLTGKIPNLDNQKIEVVGIPIFIEPQPKNKKESKLILWNHRLQKQKNPWVLFSLEKMVKENISICTPEALSAAYSKEMKEHENVFRNIIRDNGKKRQNYLNELKRAEFVLSTSEHETWGNSMIEGIMNGAVPFAPDGDLCSYKELYPKDFLYPQELIKKEKNMYTRRDNMVALSYMIDDFIRKDHSTLLRDLQQDLWNKYNKNVWLEKL
jgi:hypothetical protein